MGSLQYRLQQDFRPSDERGYGVVAARAVRTSAASFPGAGDHADDGISTAGSGAVPGRAAGGVGTFAAQIAKSFGAKVTLQYLREKHVRGKR
jgi:hypothetical protein